MRFQRRQVLVLCAPLGALLGGWLILPALVGLISTLTSYAPLSPAFNFVGLANYLAVLRDREFATAIRNVIVFCLIAVPLELAIGLGIAYALREPFRGRGLLRVLLLLPWLLSPIGAGVMWHFLFDSATGLPGFVLGWLGLAATSPAASPALALPTAIAIEVWRLAPLVAFLLIPGLEAVPAERWEDARLDGLGLGRRIANVALPAIGPLLAAVAMLMIGLSLATFDSILILTGGGPGTATITPALFSYHQAFEVDNWPVGSASAWLVAFGLLGVGAIYLRLAGRRT
jgi:ABC-type sugar transport system permease subunit